jgi:F0F1-type ATP synthase assembly protein I
MTDKPTRRDLFKPVQLLGLALAAAVFAGVVVLISMGFFQDRFSGQGQHALVIGLIAAGITLLVLVVDPAQVTKTIDGPVLLTKDAQKAEKNDADSGTDAP